MRHSRIPGDQPGLFLPKTRVPGSAGDLVMWKQNHTKIGDHRSADTLTWPDRLNSYRVLDWINGNGTSPEVGPALTLFGSLSSADTLWQDSTETPVTTDSFSAGNLRTATPVDPSANDAVIRILFRPSTEAPAGQIMATRTATRGWQFFTVAGPPLALYFLWQGNTQRFIGFGNVNMGAWYLITIVVNRDSNVYGYLGTKLVGSGPTPAGSADSGAGIGIGTRPAFAAINFVGDIVRAQVFYGVGIADLVNPLGDAAAIVGVAPKQGSSTATLARTGVQVGYGNSGSLHILTSHIPVSGNALGFLPWISTTNKCYKNYGIKVGDSAILNVTGGIPITEVNDAANLVAAGLRELGIRVFQVNNTSGAIQYLYYGAATGGALAHAISVRGRYVAGSGAILGLYDQAGVVWTAGPAIVDSFVQSAARITPANALQQFAIRLPVGCQLNFVLCCLWQSSIINPESVNAALAATATANAGTETLPNVAATTLLNSHGSVRFSAAPRQWDSSQDGVNRRIVTHAVAPQAYANLDDATQDLKCADGTLTAAAAVVEAAGAYKEYWTGWGNRGIVADIRGGNKTSQGYDGSMGSSGVETVLNINRYLRFLAYHRRQAP